MTEPRGLQPRTMLRLVSDLRLDLKDDSKRWTKDELERSIVRATSDLSRFLPRELILDITLTSDDIVDYASIDLAGYINAENGMEGMIRVRRIEYPTGNIPQSFCQYDMFGSLLTITGMGESSEQERLSVGETIRIYYDAPHIIPTHDEAGSAPPFLDDTLIMAASSYALFQMAINYMHQAGDDTESAGDALTAVATALDKVATYLAKPSAEPTDAKAALDKIAALMTNAEPTAAVTALNKITALLTSSEPGAAVTALDKVAAILASAEPGDVVTTLNKVAAGLTSSEPTKASASLDKVNTYLANNTGEDSVSWLTKITTDVASIRTALVASLNAAKSYLDAVATDASAADSARANYIPNYVDGASAPSSKAYLTSGGALLNTIADGGEGQEVPLAYREFARSTAEALVSPHEKDREYLAHNATIRTNAAMIYAQEAAQRISNLRTYIEQAAGWGEVANTFVREAEQRLIEAASWREIAASHIREAEQRLGVCYSWRENANTYIREAEQRISVSYSWREIANTYVREAEQRLAVSNAWMGIAGIYVGEAEQRLSICLAWREIAATFIREAEQRLAEASQYNTNASSLMLLSERFRDMAYDRRNEVWSIWRDRTQLIGDYSQASMRQMTG